MEIRTWNVRDWSHDMDIGTLGGPNDPFCGHLWLDGVMEPLEMVLKPTSFLKKSWLTC